MKILSIDVGMKNLAYCLLNYEDDYTIEKWDIIDLCENTTHICKGKLKNGVRCSKETRSLTMFGFKPLIFETRIKGKYFSPSFGGLTLPLTVSPVFNPNNLI